MNSKLWNACLHCSNNRCLLEAGKKLFVTNEEKLRLPEINKSFPCRYFNEKRLCKVHSRRPFDCRLFPFDMIEREEKLFWIKWKFNCAISRITDEEKLECFPKEHKKNLLPRFRVYLREYAGQEMTNWELESGFQLLREVKM